MHSIGIGALHYNPDQTEASYIEIKLSPPKLQCR